MDGRERLNNENLGSKPTPFSGIARSMKVLPQELYEIDTPHELHRMFEDEQINVSMETILTHFLFDFKDFCDTLAFLDKNMILFCYKLPS